MGNYIKLIFNFSIMMISIVICSIVVGAFVERPALITLSYVVVLYYAFLTSLAKTSKYIALIAGGSEKDA